MIIGLNERNHKDNFEPPHFSNQFKAINQISKTFFYKHNFRFIFYKEKPETMSIDIFGPQS